MKPKQKPQDPIEAAVAATCSRQFKARLKKAHEARWKLSDATVILDREKADAWKDAQKCVRRTFRAEFRGPKWQGLNICFSRIKDYSTDYRTFETRCYMEYTATWHGISVARTIRPTCIEDVKAEAWLLAGVLLAWKEVA